MLVPKGWLHMYEMDTENFNNPNLSEVVANAVFKVLVRDRTFASSVFTTTLA